jgi:hypothetical protein
LIGVSAALDTLWHIYVGCVLQLMVWVTNFQHYFTFIDENFLCPTILNSYLLFLLVSIGAVMPVYFEEYHGWRMRHLEWCYNEYCCLFIHSSAHISCDATEFNILLSPNYYDTSLHTAMDINYTMLHLHLWLFIFFHVHNWRSQLIVPLAAFKWLTLFLNSCILCHHCSW